MLRLKPQHLATHMNEEQAVHLSEIARRLKNLADSKLGGQELFYKLEALDLDNPESILCKLAGFHPSGATLCCNCPFGPEAAGCMNSITPILTKALKGNSGGARLDIERLYHIITLAVMIFRARPEQSENTATD